VEFPTFPPPESLGSGTEARGFDILVASGDDLFWSGHNPECENIIAEKQKNSIEKAGLYRQLLRNPDFKNRKAF